MVSILTSVVTGFYRLLTLWGRVAWIFVVLGTLVLEIGLFVVLTKLRMAAIEQAMVTEKGSLQRRICSFAAPLGRITLSDMRLIIASNGSRQEHEADSDSQRYPILHERLGIVL